MTRPPYGARTTCESCMLIDVRRWHRKGLLSAGQHFTNSWTFGDEPAGTIGVRTEANAVVLTYRTRSCRPPIGNRSVSECQSRGQIYTSAGDVPGSSVRCTVTDNTVDVGWRFYIAWGTILRAANAMA